MADPSHFSSGPTSGPMSLPAARNLIRPQIEELVRNWRQQNPLLFCEKANEITFLTEFGFRRQANGCVKLIEPGMVSKTMPFYGPLGLDSEQINYWLLRAANMKVRLLVLAELIQHTGLTKLDLSHLGELDPLCCGYVNVLLGDDRGVINLAPVVSAIHHFLDSDSVVMKMAQYARDTVLSLATYNLIAANRETWKLLEAQATGLMPLVGYACRQEIIPFDTNVFQHLKQYGKQHGLTEAGWKMLCKGPVGCIRFILSFYLDAQRSLDGCFLLASHYGAVGELPDFSLVLRHIDFCESRGRPPGSIPVWFDAAAISECQRLKSIGRNPTDFANDEYRYALDWMVHYIVFGGEPDAHQRKAGWKWIRRQADAWHDQQIHQKAVTEYTWESALGAYHDSGFEIVPLTSSQDLTWEGQQMHHCVGSYAESCHDGFSRIFSIRKNGERLATAQLVKFGASWRLNQNRGPCNSQPSPEIMAVAKRLQDRYNAAAQTARA